MRPKLSMRLLAVGAVLLLALAAACSSADEGGSPSEDSGVQAPSAAGSERALGISPGEQDQAPQDSESSLPDLTGRKIVRSATIDLSVESITGAVSNVSRIAREKSGYVSESNVFMMSGEDRERTQTATVTIRVPADSFEDVMERLRGIAREVEAETSNASEVTEEYTDLEARLKNLEAAQIRYRELFERAQNIPEILTVQERLDSVQLEIERVQGRLQVLDNLTSLATITVNLSIPAAAVEGGGENWAVRAAETSWEVSKDALVVLGTAAIATVVLMLWLIPIGLAGLLAWKLFGKRIADLARRLYQA